MQAQVLAASINKISVIITVIIFFSASIWVSRGIYFHYRNMLRLNPRVHSGKQWLCNVKNKIRNRKKQSKDNRTLATSPKIQGKRCRNRNEQRLIKKNNVNIKINGLGRLYSSYDDMP
jgi:hypothetical protein